MAKPGSDRDGAMVDKQAGKKVCEPSQEKADHSVCGPQLLCHVIGESRSSLHNSG